MTSSEYSAKIRKAGSVRFYDVRNSYGTRDYYWWYKKQSKATLTEKEYIDIIKAVNLKMINEVSNDRYVVFPLSMGELSTYYIKPHSTVIDGEVVHNRAIDWPKTLKLWYEDPECEKNKTLLYIETPIIKHVSYSKGSNTYKNKQYFSFEVKRSCEKAVAISLQNNKIKPIIYG